MRAGQHIGLPPVPTNVHAFAAITAAATRSATHTLLPLDNELLPAVATTIGRPSGRNASTTCSSASTAPELPSVTKIGSSPRIMSSHHAGGTTGADHVTGPMYRWLRGASVVGTNCS